MTFWNSKNYRGSLRTTLVFLWGKEGPPWGFLNFQFQLFTCLNFQFQPLTCLNFLPQFFLSFHLAPLRPPGKWLLEDLFKNKRLILFSLEIFYLKKVFFWLKHYFFSWKKKFSVKTEKIETFFFFFSCKTEIVLFLFIIQVSPVACVFRKRIEMNDNEAKILLAKGTQLSSKIKSTKRVA